MSCVRRLWNKRGKLSFRLTRTYALTFTISTLCLSICIYLVSWQFLIRRQQTDLLASAQSIVDIFYEELSDGSSPADPELFWELNTDRNMMLLLLAPDRTLLNQMGNYAVYLEDLPVCNGQTVLYTQRDGLALLARGTEIWLDGEDLGSLIVVYRLDQECEFLEMLVWLLLALNVLGAALSLGVGRYTAGRMLQPISEMIQRARAIDAQALNVRIEVPPTEDELQLLALTVNDMLDRVEAAFARQAQFTQDASHELRTPLAVLQGNADLLARWGKDDPAVCNRCIAAIQRQVSYMHHLVESLLFLARGGNGAQMLQRAHIRLESFLAEIVEERRDIDALHHYTLQMDSALRPLYADSMLLRQLLLILIDNAAQYTPKGGGIHLSAMQKEDWVQILLRDEGCGVPEGQLEKIFERFYRVDKARARQTGGTGLGLSIARTIAEWHGGTISAHNAHEGGLCVSILLPDAGGEIKGSAR